jgi:hypothetical protein
MLVQYNCHTKTKKHLKSKDSHILSISVAEDIIAVFENKITTRKTIAQIVNQTFDGSLIETGRIISKVEG